MLKKIIVALVFLVFPADSMTTSSIYAVNYFLRQDSC